MEDIVKYLIQNKMTISTMESCTGGLLASLITDISGASDIMKFSAVTYSNEFKIKMGVDKAIIDKYTVYSKETSEEMAYHISQFTNSDIGVGITGRLTTSDFSGVGADICIYDKRNDQYYHTYKVVDGKSRVDNKREVVEEFIKLFNSTIKE